MNAVFSSFAAICLGIGLAHSASQQIYTDTISPVISEILKSSSGHRILSCEPHSVSPAELFWTGPDGQRIGFMPTENIFSAKQDGKLSLVVQKLEKNQVGKYACNEKNAKGEHFQRFYHLEAAAQPEFKNKFEDITVLEGTDVEIICQAEGDPDPTYIWYSQDGTEIVQREGQIFITEVEGALKLTIKNISPDLRGLYACSATNSHGLVTKLHRINVVGSTGNDSAIVEDASAVKVTENCALFDLKISNSTADLWDIHVLYNDSSNETNALWKKGDRLEICDLTPSGKYDFRFRVGPFGRWSERYQVVMLPDVPDVIFNSLNAGTIEIRFMRMLSDISRDTIDKHRVTYVQLQMEGGERFVPRTCELSFEIPKCMGNQHVMSGLNNYSYYEIRVEAHTAAGYGKPYRQKVFVSRR